MIISYTLLKYNRLQLDIQIMWMEVVLKLDLRLSVPIKSEYPRPTVQTVQ